MAELNKLSDSKRYKECLDITEYVALNKKKRQLKKIKKIKDRCSAQFLAAQKDKLTARTRALLSEDKFEEATALLSQGERVLGETAEGLRALYQERLEKYRLRQRLSKENTGGKYTLKEVVRIAQNIDIRVYGDFLPKGTLHMRLDEMNYTQRFFDLKKRYKYLSFHEILNILMKTYHLIKETCPLKPLLHVDLLKQLKITTKVCA